MNYIMQILRGYKPEIDQKPDPLMYLTNRWYAEVEARQKAEEKLYRFKNRVTDMIGRFDPKARMQLEKEFEIINQ